MQKINGRSRFCAIWHFNDEERGDIYFSLAYQGESCSSVARHYEVSPSVIRRMFRQMVEGSVTFRSVSAGEPQQGVGGARPRAQSADEGENRCE